MSDSSTPSPFDNVDSRSKNKSEFKIEIDPKIGEAFQGGLQGGVDALGQLFTGLMKSITNAVGPELVRNVSASQWLEQVATSLDEVAAAWRSDQATPVGKSGELTCYLDRIAEEVAGSRVESQLAALRDRLTQVLALVDNEQRDLKIVTNVAGYFHASAKSAMPNQSGNDNSKSS